MWVCMFGCVLGGGRVETMFVAGLFVSSEQCHLWAFKLKIKTKEKRKYATQYLLSSGQLSYQRNKVIKEGVKRFGNKQEKGLK